ncbi:MAG: hypothetical protein Q8O33_17165 [Pseudomonadota bacterium]|nr:hypothetical protein [Pseudomonadota bacterium]
MLAYAAKFVLLALPFCLVAGAWAACPALPEGFVPPPERHSQVDLQHELAQPWQAGGEIVLLCAPGGEANARPLAGRRALPPANAEAESARRAEHFALARRLNFAHKGEVNTRTLALLPQHIELLERFALSDAGAVWFREVADDTLRLFNKGYLEYDQALWRRALSSAPGSGKSPEPPPVGAKSILGRPGDRLESGRIPKLSQLLTGRLTEAGQFAEDAQVFKFGAYAGPGAMAQPGGIGLGDAGLRCHFPSSDELVDPHAILSHEFGHTRYGDPDSAGTLLGEARTVERYENPVRVRNGYEPRTLYFERTDQGKLEPGKGSLLERLKILEREKGISITDQLTVDRYHCDCPGPLPVFLNCEVRRRPGADGITSPAFEHDCKLNWKPEPQDVDTRPGLKELAPRPK